MQTEGAACQESGNQKKEHSGLVKRRFDDDGGTGPIAGTLAVDARENAEPIVCRRDVGVARKAARPRLDPIFIKALQHVAELEFAWRSRTRSGKLEFQAPAAMGDQELSVASNPRIVGP